MKVKIINLTPHQINIFNEENQLITVYPSSGTIRLETSKQKVSIEGLSDIADTFKIVRSQANKDLLPKQKPNTFYIVSSMVQEAHPERKDFIAPNTSADAAGAVRDDKGNIIGVRSFVVQ